MHRHKDLIRYHLQSAMELATEDELTTLRFIVTVALGENEDPESTMEEPDASEAVIAAKRILAAE